jgi:hypothetical protein
LLVQVIVPGEVVKVYALRQDDVLSITGQWMCELILERALDKQFFWTSEDEDIFVHEEQVRIKQGQTVEQLANRYPNILSEFLQKQHKPKYEFPLQLAPTLKIDEYDMKEDVESWSIYNKRMRDNPPPHTTKCALGYNYYDLDRYQKLYTQYRLCAEDIYIIPNEATSHVDEIRTKEPTLVCIEVTNNQQHVDVRVGMKSAGYFCQAIGKTNTVKISQSCQTTLVAIKPYPLHFFFCICRKKTCFTKIVLMTKS